MGKLARVLSALGVTGSLVAFVAYRNNAATRETDADYTALAAAKAGKGDLAGAIADYSKAIERDPSNTTAMLQCGLLRTLRGDHTGAIADFDKLIAREPELGPAYAARGGSRHETGDLKGALADYQKAIEIDPRVPENHINAGVAKYDLNDFNSAITSFSQALSLKPDDTEVHALRGSARAAITDTKGAISDYDAALRQRPDDGKLFNYRAHVKVAEGRYEAAVADYNQAVRLTKGELPYPQIFRYLAQSRLSSSKLPQQELSGSLKNWPQGWPKQVALLLCGSLSEAAFLEEAQRGDDQVKCEAFYYVGMSHLLAGKHASAEAFLKKCVNTAQAGATEFQLAKAELARIPAI